MLSSEMMVIASEAIIATGFAPAILPIAGITALAYGLHKLF